MSKAFSLIHNSGGLWLIRDYVKLGVAGKVLRGVCNGIVKGKPLGAIHDGFQPDVVRALSERYRPLMVSRLDFWEKENLERKRADIVWFCWLQGLESAPPIVRACYESLKRNLVGKEIRVVDDGNRRVYVRLPEFIEERWRKKKISPALFSDLIRLELLIKFGGTWIDSTVLCSGEDYPREYMDSDLFFFQYKRSLEDPFGGISNWFITSCSNNPLLLALRDLLYAYWKDFKSVPEYFIFHIFFSMIAVARAREVTAMPYGYSPKCHVLQRHWGEEFNAAKWEKLVSEVQIHKLTHKISDEIKRNKRNYYHYVVHEYVAKKID